MEINIAPGGLLISGLSSASTQASQTSERAAWYRPGLGCTARCFSTQLRNIEAILIAGTVTSVTKKEIAKPRVSGEALIRVFVRLLV